MKHAALFLGMSLALTELAWAGRPGRAWLLWPATSFLILSFGYFRLGPGIFAKRADGRLALFRQIILWPYSLFLHAVWNLLRRIKSEAAWNKVSPRLIIGRRLLSGERPDGIALVVDLTSEFSEPAAMRSGDYFCLPILDASIPSLEEFLNGIERVASHPGPIYVHCAEGHGRTALFAAALLIRWSEAENSEQAMARLSAARPLVRLNSEQARFFESAIPALIAARAP